MKINDQKGLTLVEILASIVLLTVIIGFFIVNFPNISNINNKIGENLNAANTGKELLVMMKESGYQSTIAGTLPVSNPKITYWKQNIEVNKSEADSMIVKGTYNNFNVNIIVTINPEINTQTLHRIQIQILNSNNSTITTIYGYLE